MQNSFNRLIDSYIDEKVGVTEDFLSEDLAAHLKNNLTTLHDQQQLFSAGIGNGQSRTLNPDFRRDKIHWLDKHHQDPYEDKFFEIMDQFISHMNRTCYTSISGYEFHYTLYEPGSFYKKHIDQFRNNPSRQYSMIIYLNEGWQKSDGGALCIYPSGEAKSIYPHNKKAVLFKSNELEHEVLITNRPRMSITGWLKN